MRYLSSLLLIIFGIGMGVSLSLNAVDNTSSLHGNTQLHPNAPQHDSPLLPSARQNSDEMAEVWGLTEREWTEYLTIKQGPRGYWSPNLDPLTALGIHADTDAKKRKYARLLAKLEKTRVEQELAFGRIYAQEYHTLYPDADTLRRDEIRQQLVKRNQQGTTFKAGDRALAFVKPDCAQCLALPGLIIERAKAIPRFAVDFYFVGADITHDDIRQWATQVGIPKTLVDAGRITLNYDQGTLARLTKNPLPTLPQVIRDRPNSETRYELIPLENVRAY